ncbi:MAG: phosphatase [Lysobacteraceae bacterium]|nr:MAG: phosphatase [Xanthomonadaceae bacterium]
MHNRRQFLSASVAAATLLPFRPLLAMAATGGARIDGYGPLAPVADETTGLPLLKLPEGFRYISFGWTGDEMSDGVATPARHDGMAVIKTDGDLLTLVRNHEITSDDGAYGDPKCHYDSAAGGGTSTLVFDAKAGQWKESFASLSGTLTNCAGGRTPWGSWLTCEEIVVNPGAFHTRAGRPVRLEKPHGFVLEVPAGGAKQPQAITDMGQFVHEAVAIDRDSGIAYLTEDRNPEAGWYRFIPNKAGDLLAGGKLQAARVVGHPDMRSGLSVGERHAVEWVDIDEPAMGHSKGTEDRSGVYTQAAAGGASKFTRLEGCWAENGLVCFTATNGGEAGAGQVFAYRPAENSIELLYQSPGRDVLDAPDNLTLSPRGGLVLCEDGSRYGSLMHGLTPAGELFSLAENNVELSGQHNGIEGDFRDSEWCGACFSDDGQWLFANIQTPGITFAITGPWSKTLG